MLKSEQINELAAALAKAQAAMSGAKKDAANPFFRSKYADLASVVDAIKQPLAANGLSYVQTTDADESAVYVETVLMHSSGQWISGRLRMPVAKPNDPQALGSAFTYCRRYGLQAICGVPAEDDDGNAAAANHPAVKAAQANITPNAGAGDNLTAVQKQKVDGIASSVIDCFEAGQIETAHEVIEEAGLDVDEKLALWAKLDSKTRSALKKVATARKQAAVAETA